jgi:hypothetical protein
VQDFPARQVGMRQRWSLVLCCCAQMAQIGCCALLRVADFGVVAITLTVMALGVGGPRVVWCDAAFSVAQSERSCAKSFEVDRTQERDNKCGRLFVGVSEPTHPTTATEPPPLHFQQQLTILRIFRRNSNQKPRITLARLFQARIPIFR